MLPRRLTGTFAAGLLGGLFLLPGCAQMATVRCWQPATIDVSGIERLAVVDFSGEGGSAVAAALNSRLSDNRFYSVVDASELTTVQHAAYAPDPGNDALLAQARERGIDGVVFGEVTEYRWSDPVGGDAVNPSSTVSGASPEAGDSTVAAGVPLRRDASVAVTFRLVDARTGEIRAVKAAEHVYSSAADSTKTPLPSRDEVLTKLTAMCLDDFVEVLAPHQSESRIKLACGGWYGRDAADVRGGNRLAIRGDWDSARDRWEAVINRNAECDAALFNLAIDAAHRQQYSRAEELAMQAIRIRHTDQYASGLARIREYRTGYDAVAEQRDRRVLQAFATLP